MIPVEIALDGLCVARGGRVLFPPITTRICAGAFVAVRGANGAGKSSLLRAMAGLLRPEAGAVQLLRSGRPLGADDARLSCLLLSHEDALKPQRSARQEAQYWALALGGAPARVEPALSAMDLMAQADMVCQQLSAGQKRRAALMRLALTDRPVWLLDEPIANVDDAGRTRLESLVEGHRARGGIVLAALHEAWPVRDGAVIALGAA